MDTRGALFDLNVVEIGTEIAAPYAGRLLADLGAAVVKVEPPGGDPGRWLGPFPDDRPDPDRGGALFHYLNAGKRLLTLDIADGAGRRDLDDLIAGADVLIDNRPSAETRRLGLDHGALADRHPHLIAAYITVFGQTGPDADHAAHDLTACAASGVCAGIGIPGKPPLTMPFQQGQYQGGLAAASGSLAAWIARERIGRGQLVDIAIAEVWSDFFGGMHAPEMIFRGVLGLQMGWRSGLGRYPQTILPCKDGYLSLSAPQGAQWLRFVDLIGEPEWTKNPRYRDRRAMGQEYPDEVDALLADWLMQHTKDEIFAVCRERRIPFAPVRTVADLLADPQLAHRRFFAPLDLGNGRVVQVPTGPYAFSETPIVARGGPLPPTPSPEVGGGDDGTRASLPPLPLGEGGGEGVIPLSGTATLPLPGGDRPAKSPFPGGEGRVRGRPTTASTDATGRRQPQSGPIVPGPRTPDPGPRTPDPEPRSPVPGPLAGLRVVNFGTAMAGPLAAQILCDLGAEVIKIESRKRLDGLRQGRPLLGGAAAGDAGDAPELQPMFHALNRGEKSLTIDFKDPEGWAILRELIRRSDVIVENFSPGVLERAGFGYAKLAAEQPDLIVLAMSAVGQTGPLSDTIAYAPTTMALGGITGITGYRDGRVLMPQIAYGDVSASLHAVYAVLAALVYREKTGQGQYIDFAQEESVAICLAEPLLDYQLNGRVAGPQDNDLAGYAPHNTYRCQDDDSGLDRYVSIAVRTDDEWRRLVEAIGSPEWARDPAYATVAGREAAREAIDARLGEWTVGLAAWEVTERLQARQVAAFPVQNVQDEYFDPHYQEREVFVHVDHPIVGTLALPRLAWVLSETPGSIAGPAPTLGQHNEYVLREVLGLSDEEVSRLAECGVLT